jgi:hypothetical protein
MSRDLTVKTFNNLSIELGRTADSWQVGVGVGMTCSSNL